MAVATTPLLRSPLACGHSYPRWGDGAEEAEVDESGVPVELGAAAVSRRTIFRAAGAGFGLWLVGSVGGRTVAVEVPAGVLPMAIPGGTLDPALGEPAGWDDRPCHPSHLHLHARGVHRAGADRHPRAWGCWCGRRERWLRRGVVSFGGDQRPGGICHRRHLVQLLRRESRDQFRGDVGAYPGQVTRVRAQFNTPGQYVWHCLAEAHPGCVGAPDAR